MRTTRAQIAEWSSILCLICAASHAGIITLPPVGSLTKTDARGVNDDGVVSGYSYSGSFPQPFTRVNLPSTPRALKWEDVDSDGTIESGEFNDLGTLRSDDQGSAWGLAINDAESIVGRAESDEECDDAFDTPLVLGFYDDGTMDELPGLLNQTDAPEPWAINDLQTPQITGARVWRCRPAQNPLEYVPLVWESGPTQNPTVLPIPAALPSGLNSEDWVWAEEAIGLGINDSTEIAGFGRLRSTPGNRYHRAMRWVKISGNWVAQDMFTLAGNLDEEDDPFTSEAHGINSDGAIVGLSDALVESSLFTRAFLWIDDDADNAPDLGEMIDLGDLGHSGGPVDSEAYAINDNGDVVGRVEFPDANWVAFFWSDEDDDGQSDPGEMVNLNEFVPVGACWDLEHAWDISNTCIIVGYGQDCTGGPSNCVTRGFIFTFPESCRWDIAPVGNPDGTVGSGDLGELLSHWGSCSGCTMDFNCDGTVGAFDQADLLANWGSCTSLPGTLCGAENVGGGGEGGGESEALESALLTAGFETVAEYIEWTQSANEEELESMGWLLHTLLTE